MYLAWCWKKKIYDLHKKCLNNCVTLNPLHLQKSGVLAFTCNLATLKAEFWNGLGSVPGGSDDLSIGESIVWPPSIMLKGRNLIRHWDLTET